MTKTKHFTFFEYSNTSGQVFRVPFNTPEEKEKAYKKMFRYYNDDRRMHPLWEILDLYEDERVPTNPTFVTWEKAKKGHIPSIKKLLKQMWDNDPMLSSFYGKVVKVKA
jgi:hypothetical protein